MGTLVHLTPRLSSFMMSQPIENYICSKTYLKVVSFGQETVYYHSYFYTPSGWFETCWRWIFVTEEYREYLRRGSIVTLHSALSRTHDDSS